MYIYKHIEHITTKYKIINEGLLYSTRNSTQYLYIYVYLFFRLFLGNYLNGKRI